MKKIILSIFIISSFYSNVYSENNDECFTNSSKSGYDLFLERNKCICNKYKSSENLVNLIDAFPKIISEEEMKKLTKEFDEKLIKLRKNYSKTYDKQSSTFKNFEIDKLESVDKKKIEENTKIGKQIREIEIKRLEKIHGLTDKYSLKDVKLIHREAMNNIYKCGLINTQIKAIRLIKNDLIKKSPILAKKIEGKLEYKISHLEMKGENLGCKKTQSKNSVQKIQLLKQSTFETCKYINYLEYLKEHLNKVNQIDFKNDKVSPVGLTRDKANEYGRIEKEIKQTYKVFPLAFQSYSEYENNITQHLLLELIKEDYYLLRDKLHKVVNPINQVVYKISNAMKK